MAKIQASPKVILRRYVFPKTFFYYELVKRRNPMIRIMVVLVCIGFLGLTGCKNSQEREADANAEIAEERAKIMKKYTEMP